MAKIIWIKNNSKMVSMHFSKEYVLKMDLRDHKRCIIPNDDKLEGK